MDEIFKYLIIAAFIVFGIVKQARTGKGGSDESAPHESVPPSPLPENWGGGTAGGGLFDVLKPRPVDPQTERAKKKKAVKQPAAARASAGVASGYTRQSANSASSSTVSPPEPEGGLVENGIDVRSAEEVRKGFIWSVILERKYD